MNDDEVRYLEELRTDAAAKTVLGHLSVKSPGYKGIEEWARSTLHTMFSSIAFIRNRYFEASFTTAEGA
jgi:hypothetical protein